MRGVLAGMALMMASLGGAAEAHDRRGYVYAPYPPTARYVPPPRVYYPPPYLAAPPPVYVVPRPVPYGHYGHYVPYPRPHHHRGRRPHGGAFFSFGF